MHNFQFITSAYSRMRSFHKILVHYDDESPQCRMYMNRLSATPTHSLAAHFYLLIVAYMNSETCQKFHQTSQVLRLCSGCLSKVNFVPPRFVFRPVETHNQQHLDYSPRATATTATRTEHPKTSLNFLGVELRRPVPQDSARTFTSKRDGTAATHGPPQTTTACVKQNPFLRRDGR
jgi:hypothetical protein